MTAERKQAEEILDMYWDDPINVKYECALRAMESYAPLRVAEATKYMYPKEYVRWIGENEMFRNKGNNGKWLFQTEPYIIWKSDDELFEYWKQNISK